MFRLISQLRRRRVFRAAGYYLLAAWGALQVGDVIVEPAGLPAWSMTALLYLLVAGFPIAMVLSWRYDIGEHGLVRTRADIDVSEEPPEKLRAVDYLIIVALLGISGVAIHQLLPAAQRGEVAEVASEEAVGPQLRENAIAVLPFADIGGGQAFLGDGISDTVLHVLSQIAELSVTARTSSFAFRDQNLSIREIAERLNVAHVLEGSVQAAGDQVRIIARLINARDGTEVWSGYYDRAVDSIFAIQDEIAREVATAMTTTVLGRGSSAPLEERYRPSLAAYEKVVLGRQQLAIGTRESLLEARALFEAALALDANYPIAYILLSESIKLAAGMQGRAVALRESEALIAQALDLDPQLPEAHAQQAEVLLAQKRFAESEAAIRRAIELQPSFAEAYATYAHWYRMQGRTEETLGQMRKAVELDPESDDLRAMLAQSLWEVGRAEEALDTIRETLRRKPDWSSGYGFLSRWSMQLGRMGEALYWATRMLERDPGSPDLQRHICFMELQLWAFEEAQACMARFLEAHPGDHEGTQYLAILTRNAELGVANAREAVAENPSFSYRRYQLADWLAEESRSAEALSILEPAAPGLFADPPAVQQYTIWGAQIATQALLDLGERERAETIAEAGLRFVRRSRKVQSGGFTEGTEDVRLLLLLGREDEALQRLESAVASGWMFFSFGLHFTRIYDPVRDDPRFARAVQTLAATMERERAWFEAHRDDPVETLL